MKSSTGWQVVLVRSILVSVLGKRRWPQLQCDDIFQHHRRRRSTKPKFTTTGEWKQIRVPLNGFTRLELSSVSGFSFNAIGSEGEFSFIIDNVEIR